MINKYGVGSQGEKILISRPVPSLLTVKQAINLAAWLTVYIEKLSKSRELESGIHRIIEGS